MYKKHNYKDLPRIIVGTILSKVLEKYVAQYLKNYLAHNNNNIIIDASLSMTIKTRNLRQQF